MLVNLWPIPSWFNPELSIGVNTGIVGEGGLAESCLQVIQIQLVLAKIGSIALQCTICGIYTPLQARFMQPIKWSPSTTCSIIPPKISGELHTSYFRARDMFEVLNKFYHGREQHEYVLFSLTMNPEA